MEGAEGRAVMQPVLSPRPHAHFCTLAVVPLWLWRARRSRSQRRKANAITCFQIAPATGDAQITRGQSALPWAGRAHDSPHGPHVSSREEWLLGQL